MQADLKERELQLPNSDHIFSSTSSVASILCSMCLPNGLDIALRG